MSSKPPLAARKAGIFREDTEAASTSTNRSLSSSRHSARSQNSIPRTFEGPKLSLDEQIRNTMEEILEKAARAGKGNEKGVSHEINLSEHPYYEQETSKHPSRYRVRSLAEFRSIILDDNEGPRWYEFLSKAISHGRTIHEKRFSLQKAHEELLEAKKQVKQFKQINDLFAAEKDEDERQIYLVREELSHKEIELERALEAKIKLQKEKEVLIRRLANPDLPSRSQREDVIGTQNIAEDAQICRPRGIHLSKPLKGEDFEEYSPWAYFIRKKLQTNPLCYADDGEKVDYALSQMEAPILGAMRAWVVDMGNSLTTDELFDEVEHYMSIHSQIRDARKELVTISMNSSESVSEYYHRISKLWQKAKTPVNARIEKFLVTLKPSISSSLMGSVFTEFGPLLDSALRIEEQRKDIARIFPRPNRPASLENPARAGHCSGVQSPASFVRWSHFEEKKSVNHPNSIFSPTIARPAGWTADWYDPEFNPKKLDQGEREKLMRQGRCWACRGSGHRGNDSICPMNIKRKLNSTQVVEVDSNSNSDSKEL